MTVKIALLDFGVKQSIINCLKNINCEVEVIDGNVAANTVIERQPDAIVLSNGPNDPADNIEIIENIKLLVKANIPIFGICLGHQMLGLALGATTYKMSFGHHGANHPVQDVDSKKIYITSQNHNYAIAEQDLPMDIKITHRSLFDNSIQGIRHKDLPLFGFQGHPEAGPGPQDAFCLFKEFLQYAKKN